MVGKGPSLAILLVAECCAMSLWFVSAAILPDMTAETAMSPLRQAALSSGVQAGFVAGALVSAVLSVADRHDPRRVLGVAAMLAGVINLTLLVSAPGSAAAIAARFATGALLAGVYPVGMKIAVGWGQRDRGFIVGALVGALTLGSALPHLFALGGGSDWRFTVALASAAAIAWTNRRVRLAYAGYFGHMWELYAMWAWVAVISAASYRTTLPDAQAVRLATITAFCAIAAGAVTCVLAGRVADRIGKADVALWAMAASGSCALLAALTFGGPAWVTFAIVLFWGASIVPDSAQFSALVADNAPPDRAGSLMTLQTAIGFALTFVTVQITPVLAGWWGWPAVMMLMALGPAFGIYAMARLRALS